MPVIFAIVHPPTFALDFSVASNTDPNDARPAKTAPRPLLASFGKKLDHDLRIDARH